MGGYIPLGLILAGADPYGPTGPFPEGKPRSPIRFSLPWLFRARRGAPEAAPRLDRAQCSCAAPGHLAS